MHETAREIGQGLYVVDRAQRFLGIELGARMSVLQLEGGVLVVSPVDIDPGLLADLGTLRWALAPNLFHHLYLGRWMEAGAVGYAPLGLAEKRPELALDVVVEQAGEPFGPEVRLIPLKCFAMTQEIAVLHRPSRSLILTDLLFNLSADLPFATRAAFACLCAYPGCKTSLLERVGMNRAVARQEIAGLLALDFDRLVMAHGEVVETGGKEALEGAFGWLF
jgi:hypothetical protein